MNPESDSSAGNEAPAAANPAAPMPAVEVAAPPPPAGTTTNAPELSPAACGTRLAELFPALFCAPGAPGPARPIKLRIHADIQARAPGVFSKRMLGIFFNRHTTTNAYLKALTLAPHRFDLDGQPAGEIADEHRRLAAEELARRHALGAERRAAQRPPRREGPSAERPNEPGRAAPPSPIDARPARPPRRTGRVPHTTRPQRPERAPPLPHAEEPAAAVPVDPAQRERATLLRAFESSPLSKANFCVLKGITEAALDAALAQAQAERGMPAKAAPNRSGGR